MFFLQVSNLPIELWRNIFSFLPLSSKFLWCLEPDQWTTIRSEKIIPKDDIIEYYHLYYLSNCLSNEDKALFNILITNYEPAFSLLIRRDWQTDIQRYWTEHYQIFNGKIVCNNKKFYCPYPMIEWYASTKLNLYREDPYTEDFGYSDDY